jgi:DNA-binding NarL/FixJ family response regulator
VEVRDVPKARARGSVPTVSGSIRILVVESHSLIGAAVGELLSGPPLDALVETVLDTEVAMTRLEAKDIDLVVCELSDPPERATELAARLAAGGSGVPVVFLAGAEDKHLLLNSLKSGATGFFTMDSAPDELIQGISSVLHGHNIVGTTLRPAVRSRQAGARGGRRSS